jgi:SAM-dependent methyltransferase
MTNTAQIPGDNGGDFPDMESARAYLNGNSTTNPTYHQDRMRALRHLIGKIPASDIRNIVDFGCGDGMQCKEFFGGAGYSIDKIAGVDASKAMLQLAAENLQGFNFKGRAGGARALAEIEGEQFDLGLAINVLGYLKEPELKIFYQQMSRLIRPGGHLIVMTGNELFDMFALNSGTAAFYSKYFSLDVADLLLEGRAPRPENASRKNPLSFGAEIRSYGFNEVAQAYSQWHRIPPGIGNRGDVAGLPAARLEMRDHSYDANALPPEELWKAMFRCSIFASLSQRG